MKLAFLHWLTSAKCREDVPIASREVSGIARLDPAKQANVNLSFKQIAHNMCLQFLFR